MSEQRKLAAIMFTDIVGYSALMSKDEKKALSVLEKNRKIHKETIDKFNGEFIKEIGDGTLSVFKTSSDAVNCALAIQEMCCDDQDIKIRFGIHIGEIVVVGNDVFGDGVNIASRIEAAGESDRIYISGRVYEDIKNKAGISAEYVGEKRLKNIDYPVKVFVLGKGSPESSPPGVSHSKKSQDLKKRKLQTYFGVVILFATLTLSILYFLNHINEKNNRNFNKDLIAVAIFENKTGDESLDPIGPMASDWITQGIVNTGLVSVAPSFYFEAAENIHQNMEGIRNLAEAVGAQTIITGVYYKHGDELQFHTHIVDAKDKELLGAVNPVSGPVDEPMISIELLRQKVMGVLAANFDENFNNYSDRVLKPPLYEAYKELLMGVDFFFKKDYEEARIHFNNATNLDTTYLFPYFWVAVAYWNTDDFEKADSVTLIIKDQKGKMTKYEQYMREHLIATVNGDLERTYAISSTLAQYTLLFKYQAAYDALKINYPQATLDIMLALEPDNFYFPGMYWNFLSRAYHMSGSHKEEIKIAQKGRERHPALYMNILDELIALAALGKVEEINQRINECLTLYKKSPYIEKTPGYLMLITSRELRAHGHIDESKKILDRTIEWFNAHPDEKYRYCLAQAYYLAEQWDKSQKLIEALAEENPDDIDYLGYLGAIAARKGDRNEAERIRKLLAEKDEQYLYGKHHFWRGRIAAIYGEPELAVQLLRDAVSQGFYYFDLHPAAMDFESLQDYLPYQDLMQPKTVDD